jgi:cell division septal protein FtsQ
MFSRLKRRSHHIPPTPRKPGVTISNKDKIYNAVQGAKSSILPWSSLLLLSGIIVASPILFGWVFFSTDSFTVQTITVSGARDHTASAAKEMVTELLTQEAISKNIFLAQTDILENSMVSALPQIEQVNVRRILPSTLQVIIEEKSPSLLLLSNGHHYLINEQGIPYEQSSLDTLPGIVLPIIKNGDTSAKVTLGVRAVAPQFVEFMRLSQAELTKSLASSIVETKIPSLAAREVHFILDNNWLIKLDVTRSAKLQITTLTRVVNEVISEEDKQRLDYIDLRIPNRVYYKTR